MRRRLLLVILGTVVSALAFAAVATFFGIKRTDLGRTKRTLAQSAQRLASSGQARNLAGLESVKEALSLETAALVTFPDPATPPSASATADEKQTYANVTQVGMTAAPIAMNDLGQQLQVGGIPIPVIERILPKDLSALAAGHDVTGIVGNRVYASVRASRRGTTVEALLLTRELSSNANQAVVVILLASAAALVLAAIGAGAFARRMAQPLVEATEAYRRIASGDLSVRIERRSDRVRRNDEIGQLMRDLNTMAESLERAQKQEQQFLLSVSHDLRTPLTSIRGFAEALAEGDAADPQRAAAVISSEARRLERLVRDLLELAKLDAKRFDLHPRPIDLTDLVTDAADGFLPTSEREGLLLTLDAEEGLVASVDPDRLAQILANLIENAIKFAKTTVGVTLKSVPSDAGSVIHIEVRDDGPGIDPIDLPHVFERLYTSDRRPTRQIGSGLGLTIVKELVDAMGATVAPTTSTSGTAFTVTIHILRRAPFTQLHRLQYKVESAHS